MLHPMAGKNIDACGVHPRGKFDIMRVIPDHE